MCSATAGAGMLGVPRLALAESVRALTPVKVSLDRVTRTTVGLRPFRAGGFVLRAEVWDTKTIVHDYGHGGGGMTLSWGTALLARDFALQTQKRRAAVIGRGVRLGTLGCRNSSAIWPSCRLSSATLMRPVWRRDVFSKAAAMTTSSRVQPCRTWLRCRRFAVIRTLPLASSAILTRYTRVEENSAGTRSDRATRS
jgi:hypothetical protein